ncbi:MAG: hypothetical protein WCD16_07770 [Paracoccaceae bacterium]
MLPRFTFVLGAVALGLAAGCAPKPAPTPEPIYAEPVFDKYGNPSCRPPDQPIGGAYTANLPICEVPPSACRPGGRYANNPTICPPQRTGDNGDDQTSRQPNGQNTPGARP